MKLKCVCNVGVSVSVPENPLSLSLSVRVLANVRHLIFSWELERFHDFQTLCQMLERIRLWNPSKCALIIYTTDRIWSEIHEQTITINAILLIVFMRVFTLPPFPQSPKLSSSHILRRFSFFSFGNGLLHTRKFVRAVAVVLSSAHETFESERPYQMLANDLAYWRPNNIQHSLFKRVLNFSSTY